MLTPAELEALEARLSVRFPEAYRRAQLEGRTPGKDSRWILLPADEIAGNRHYGVPGDGVVVGRTIAGGYLLFLAEGARAIPRKLRDEPWVYEAGDDGPANVPEGELIEDLELAGTTFDDIIDADRHARQPCPHCGAAQPGAPCGTCGRSRFERRGEDPDRDAAGALIGTLVKSGQLVLRSPRSSARLLASATEVLHRVDDDAEACEQLIGLWEDSPDVDEFFVDAQALLPFVAAR